VAGWCGWACVGLADRGSDRFYAGHQAERGAVVFEARCAECHSTGLGVSPPEGLSGDAFVARWQSVAGLYARNRWTMPADAVSGLGTDAALDVTAFLLRENGFAAGRRPLVDDVRAMREMVIATPGAEPNGGSAPAGAATGFYSEAQAKRGEAYFEGSCGTCHVADPEETAALMAGTPSSRPGVRMGSETIVVPVVGPPLLEYRETVADLFLKTKTTMPIDYPGDLSDQAYLDIVAYMLAGKGLPASGHELALDLEAMRAMTLPEPGFRPLFNGRDFEGLGFLLGHGCRPQPEGCGLTEPGTTFRIEKGVLKISGRPSGYVYTEDRYLDFTLRLDMRYLPYEGMESDSDYYGNAGILLFVQEHRVWPKTVEVQGYFPQALSILPIDTPVSFETDERARRIAMRPIGEWNSIEIDSAQGRVRVSLNGELVTTVTEHEFEEPGHIGFQSEGGEVELRNIRIRNRGR
jgi:mono/diheme cytochrome c family protein